MSLADELEALALIARVPDVTPRDLMLSRLLPDSSQPVPVGYQQPQAGRSEPGQSVLIAAQAIVAEMISAGAIHVGHMMGSPSNLVPNPSLEFIGTSPVNTDAPVGPPGWGNAGANWPTGSQLYERVAGPTMHSGTHGMQFTQPGATNIIILSDLFPVIAGRKYTLSAWFRGNGANTGTGRMRASLGFYAADGSQLSLTDLLLNDVGTTTTFSQRTATITADALAVYGRVRVYQGSSATTGDISFVDDVEVYPADYDVNHAGGGVVIDATGITILDGKFTIEDEFSSTVAEAAGFSGGWLDMIRTGLYNGSLDGPAGVVATGRTASLPYWTLAVTAAGAVTATVVADATYKGGKKLRFTFPSAGVPNQRSVTSDAVAVTAGEAYSLVAQVGVNAVGTSFVGLSLNLTYYDGAGSIIDGAFYDVSNFFGAGTLAPMIVDYRSLPPGQVGNYTFTNFGNLRAPLNAATAKVSLTVSEQTAHSASNFVDIGAVHLVPALEGTPTQVAVCDVDSTLTTTAQVVSGMTELGLTAGHYLARGTFDFEISATGVGVCVAELMILDPIELALSAASDDTLDTVLPHGLAVNDKVEFLNLGGGTGLSIGTVYFVIASGLGSNTLKISTTLGGAAVNFTTDVLAGSAIAKQNVLPGQALFRSDSSLGRATVTQQWELRPTGTQSINTFLRTQVRKTINAGTAKQLHDHTSLVLEPIP